MFSDIRSLKIAPLHQIYMLRKIRQFAKAVLLTILVLFVLGLIMPDDVGMPVAGATAADYHQDSFWYYPWGRSVTHKGVDIFAKKGTAVHASGRGIVLYTGEVKIGGKVVLVLGAKWRLHYYAHLDQIHTSPFSVAGQKTRIGSVGDSGNAQGKPPHLHYAILTLLPYPWRIDNSIQGWKKMFYLNPIPYFQHTNMAAPYED